MNDTPSTDLIARVARLEQENTMLRQGMQQTARMRGLWEQAIAELQTTRQQLEQSNAQLSILQRVGAAVHQNIDLEPLLQNVMDAMEAAFPACQGQPMGLFLIDEDRMRLTATRNTDETFAAAHASLRIGRCICGRAAATGELVVVPRCGAPESEAPDCAHREPHGHLVVPLTSQGKMVGIFYYYLPAGTEIDPGHRETFLAIGQQLGLALEHARLYEETRSLSLCDALTGLANRRRMDRVLECELARVTRYERPFSVLLMDIDHFKEFNDTYGHLAGDRLLAHIGGVLENEKRENDMAVRYGGEEFLMILPETPAAGALRMAERLRSAIAAQAGVTVSVGVADALPARRDRDSLLQAADEALYRAKQNGRDRVECAPA